MGIANWLTRRRCRRVWNDPERTIATLESYARTEEDAGHDISAAIDRVGDGELIELMRRHAADERRHAELFRQRARSLREKHGIHDLGDITSDDKLLDLSRGRREQGLNAHGFFGNDQVDERGVVAYVAMLEHAEVQAEQLFSIHRELVSDDAETLAVFDEILRDEQYHVSYTRATLERWREEGREFEVRRARSAARSSRWWGAWKRAGAASASGFSRTLLRALYLTVLAPFALLARRRAGTGGWSEPSNGDPEDMRGQA